MARNREDERYGSLPWFESAYGKVPDDPWGLTWRATQQHRYLRLLRMLSRIPRDVRNVLDIGCATGDFTHLLARHIKNADEVVGVDFANAAIQRARGRFPELDFREASILTVGAEFGGRFDLAACLELLYYVPAHERGAALRSVKKALRPDGYAVFSSLVGGSPYFGKTDLLALVGTEFTLVEHEVLHLRFVSAVERIGQRVQKALPPWLIDPDRPRMRLGRLPLPAVDNLERWSRRLGSTTESHTLVLGKAT